MDRKLFEKAAKAEQEISPAELTKAINPGSLLFRFIGKLLREQDEYEAGLIRMDLVTEEGRMAALRQQGIVQGRAMFIETIIDLVTEGVEENGRDQPEPEFELSSRRDVYSNGAERN